MPVWSFYESSSGEFSGKRFRGGEFLLEVNTPPGFSAIEGEYDRVFQKVDNGVVVDKTPEQPPEDPLVSWSWDQNLKKWVGTDTPEAVRRRNNAKIVEQIQELEFQQARPIRELILDPENVDARAVIEDLDSQINVLRGQIA